ncbi:hypothetical protein T484DRAFT_1890084 [Baffinella frigidus]|nr:hypothetical protein T484DRAFT_1890084 [Cryptophyta sp. CCMP2293]
MSKHPTGHHGGGHHGAGHKQGNRGAPLDKRLNASSGKEESSMSQWNMAELKANLEDDSALLEQTLRTANKLLGETSGVQLVDVGGTVGEDGKRMLRENASGNSAAEGELARIKAGTWLTELTTKGVGREPQVLGSTLKLSEQLMLMISGLRDISPVAAMALEKVIKSDADQIRLLGRSHSRQGGKGQEHAASTISELEIRVVEEETMKLQALETNLHLQEDLTASQSSLGIAQAR